MRDPEVPVGRVAGATGKAGEVADSLSKEGKSDYFSNGRYRHYRLKGEKFHHQSLATKGAACPRPTAYTENGDEATWNGDGAAIVVGKMS